MRAGIGFEQFVCLFGFPQSRIAGKRDIGMQFLFCLGDSPKDGLCELLRRKLPLMEFFPSFVERECSKTHSMILGTWKKWFSRAGALAKSTSALGSLVTASSRIGFLVFAVWVNGSTLEVSNWLSFSMYSKILSSCSLRRSSSFGVNRSRANDATRWTSSRVSFMRFL